ncbi:MAG: thymidine phosphorylase [Acidobacteria bacterium]|nr:thymidine phosphorylase [Acidobacteriota bacterium]
MRAVDIIRAKRDGERLSTPAIADFVQGVTSGAWPDYQIAALLMAIVWRGMDAAETTALTQAMVDSGRRVDLSGLPGPRVGKHSTGGVGDKVSIVLAPIVAACGVTVPKMSGRGLGHTGGTLDKLEAIPGFRTALDLDAFRAALAAHGCAIIGQTADIAPADKALYALRDVTATIESVPLIAASVMSKKIAEGSDALVLDVKCGRGAFMKTYDEARALAQALVEIGEGAGIRTEACITRMDAPLGRAIGNALEIRECIDLVHGRGPADLEALITYLAARMLCLGGVAPAEDAAAARVREAVASGAAAARLAAMIAFQGGDAGVVAEPDRLPMARERATVSSPRAGVITQMDAEIVGRTSVVLGAGRARKGDAVDPAAGVRLLRVVGDRIDAGDPIFELHASDAARLAEAETMVRSSLVIDDEAPAATSVVLGRVSAAGEWRA